jgi:3-oxoacyl-[acyl-carrier protein] reductase
MSIGPATLISMPHLTGKVALVTGASRGIGRSIAIALAEAGADVAVNFHHNNQGADATAEAITQQGRRAITIQADVSQSDQVNRLIKTTETTLGPISVLVNNAGIAIPQSIEQLTEQDWDNIIDTNLKSCFLVTQASLPTMRRQRWGRIINISSVAAHVGGVVGAHYAASKAGMIGLTHYYASALVKEGITVNSIAPALIETDMVTSNLNVTPQIIPLGRFGRPEEVSEVVAMLTENGYITGQTIHVSGGLYMT